MNTSEFRIGNIVNEGIVVEIKHNYLRVKYQLDNRDKISLIEDAEINPEILTDEWFVRFGFKIKETPNGQKFVEFGRVRLYLGREDRNYLPLHFVVDDGWCPAMGVAIKYVHQLQNLYYSFEEKELIAEPTR